MSTLGYSQQRLCLFILTHFAFSIMTICLVVVHRDTARLSQSRSLSPSGMLVRSLLLFLGIFVPSSYACMQMRPSDGLTPGTPGPPCEASVYLFLETLRFWNQQDVLLHSHSNLPLFKYGRRLAQPRHYKGDRSPRHLRGLSIFYSSVCRE